MSQTSLIIANVSHTEYRAQDNARAQALASCMSGPVAPSSPVGGMLWLDTSVSPAVLRQRNLANSAWGPLLLVFAGDDTPEDDETLPVNMARLVAAGAATTLAVGNLASGAPGSPRIAAAAHPEFAAGDVELMNICGTNIVKETVHTQGSGGSGTSYQDQFSFHPMRDGALRMSVDLRRDDGTASVLRILKNGNAVASVSNSTGTWATYTQDFSFTVGDVVTLQHGVSYTIGSEGGSRKAQLRNLRLLGDQRGVFRI